MYGMIGGNIEAQLVQVKSKVNSIGESEQSLEKVMTIWGWLDLSSGDSRYTTYNAKTEQSTHIFVADYVEIPEKITPENCKLIVKGKEYDVLHIDNPMEMEDGSQLEIYLRYTGGAAQC